MNLSIINKIYDKNIYIWVCSLYVFCLFFKYMKMNQHKHFFQTHTHIVFLSSHVKWQ